MREARLLWALFIPPLAGVVIACGGSTASNAPDSGGDAATRPDDAGDQCLDAAPGSGAACIEAGGTCGSSGSLGEQISTSSCGDPCFWSCWALTPIDASLDAGDSAPPQDSGPSDGEGGIVWTGPAPPPGMSSCEIYNPSLGGGCVCETVENGHVYAATCADDSASCTCTIDNVPTKQIANLCEGDSTGFFQLCGFP
jgi:hypothetical protein